MSIIPHPTLRIESVCFYAGAADYIINRKKYVQRSWVSTHMPWNTGVLEQKIAECGTIRYDDSKYWHEFPPAEVVAAFPGYVGARFTKDYKIEYDGPAPKTCPDPYVPGYNTAESILRERDWLKKEPEEVSA